MGHEYFEPQESFGTSKKYTHKKLRKTFWFLLPYKGAKPQLDKGNKMMGQFDTYMDACELLQR